MSSIASTHEAGVTVIRFDRPDRLNAFDRGMLAELEEALHAAHDDPETRAIVLLGDERAFSTGADLNEYRGYDALAVREANLDTWMRVLSLIERLDEPVIAGVRGHAIAGGTELILACDLVVAGRGARFGLAEARVGVIPGAGACIRLTRWVGRPVAKEILFLGNAFDAAEAYRIGLVNRLVDDADVEEASFALAAELATRSPLALAAAKRAVNVGSELDSERGIAYALQEFALLFSAGDQKEGMAAFLEKRQPRFTGR